MTLLLTGLDPRRVLFANESHRVRQLRELTNGAPLNLIQKIVECTDADPSARPNLASVKAVTRQYISAGADGISRLVGNAEPFIQNSRRTPKPLVYK
jgi:hypothetical protein